MNKNIKCLLPKVISKGSSLKYFEYNPHSPNLEKGFGGIMEPKGEKTLDPDIIIASCSAFNEKGFRVGYGGGFFDRTIEELKKQLEKLNNDYEELKIKSQDPYYECDEYICNIADLEHWLEDNGDYRVRYKDYPDLRDTRNIFKDFLAGSLASKPNISGLFEKFFSQC